MNRWLILLAWCVCSLVEAEPVSIVLDQVSIADLAKVAYGEIARKPYVFVPNAAQAGELVTVALQRVDKQQAIAQVAQLIEAAGYRAEERNGVVWIQKAKPIEEIELFYRPKYRAVSYLVDMLAPLFKTGSFTLQRSLANPQPISTGQIQQPAPPLLDSGTSAYSTLDKNPDAFLFRGVQTDIDRLQRLLVQIDTPTPELVVKAVVFEVSTDSDERSALNLAAQLLGGKLKLSAGSATPGDYSAVFQGATLQAALDVLSSDSRFKVISAPTLRVRSGANARLTVGNETPVLGSVQYDGNGRAVQSVEYKPSGVILELKPQVREDTAELQVDQQISNFIATTTGVNSSPTLIKRELSTSVGVKPDEILVLGGLNQDQTTMQQSGLAWLPWLKSTAELRRRSEILLILQAQRI